MKTDARLAVKRRYHARPSRVADMVLLSFPPSGVALAETALACGPIAEARRLAEWVADGCELTSSGVPRPAAAAAACQELGIETRGKLRSAKDVPRLMRAWEVAVAAGFIEVAGSRAWAADDVAELRPAKLGQRAAQRVLQSWVAAACLPFEVPDDPCPYCLTALHELSLADGAMDTAQLAAAVRSAFPEPSDGGLAALTDTVCPDCGEVHDMPQVMSALGIGADDIDNLSDDEEAEEHLASTVSWMADFGVVFADPGMPSAGKVKLTPLGHLLAAVVIAGLTPAPEDNAEELIATVMHLPSKVAAAVSAPWLAARSASEAVSELLAFAEGADPDQRMVALSFAREQGDAAADAWREYAALTGFGAYARAWLAERGEQVAADERDEAWLLTDTMSMAMGAMPPEFLSFAFAGAMQALKGDPAEALAGIGASGHPNAAQILGILSAAANLGNMAGTAGFGGLADVDVADVSADAGGALYRLKITLRGVSKPPVWRRVVVPADLRLNQLHQVILRAMGWSGGHMHVFSDGLTEYGVPGSGLGHRNESGARLASLLREQGNRMTYTYDFGDDWEHDILLEQILPADPVGSYPVCLAGKGACPPEDCGGPWGYVNLKEALADPENDEHADLLEWLGLDDASDFDPAEFSIEEVNFRLAR